MAKFIFRPTGTITDIEVAAKTHSKAIKAVRETLGLGKDFPLRVIQNGGSIRKKYPKSPGRPRKNKDIFNPEYSGGF